MSENAINDAAEMDFSGLEVIEVPVKLPGDDKEYLLIQANGHAGRKYNSARIEGVTLKDGEAERISGAGDLEPLLVSLCLVGMPGRRPLGQKFIEGLPYPVIKKLHDKAKEISDLDEGESPVKKAIEVALAKPDSPISLDAFKEFVAGLDKSDKRCKPLKSLMEEDRSKNSPASTTDGFA